MKRFISFVILITLLLLITGCSSQQTSSAVSEAPPEQPIVSERKSELLLTTQTAENLFSYWALLTWLRNAGTEGTCEYESVDGILKEYIIENTEHPNNNYYKIISFLKYSDINTYQKLVDYSLSTFGKEKSAQFMASWGDTLLERDGFFFTTGSSGIPKYSPFMYNHAIRLKSIEDERVEFDVCVFAKIEDSRYNHDYTWAHLPGDPIPADNTVWFHFQMIKENGVWVLDEYDLEKVSGASSKPDLSEYSVFTDSYAIVAGLYKNITDPIWTGTSTVRKMNIISLSVYANHNITAIINEGCGYIHVTASYENGAYVIN